MTVIVYNLTKYLVWSFMSTAGGSPVAAHKNNAYRRVIASQREASCG